MRGGSSNAFTASTYTNFHFDVPKEHFLDALDRYNFHFHNFPFPKLSSWHSKDHFLVAIDRSNFHFYNFHSPKLSIWRTKRSTFKMLLKGETFTIFASFNSPKLSLWYTKGPLSQSSLQVRLSLSLLSLPSPTSSLTSYKSTSVMILTGKLQLSKCSQNSIISTS